MNRAGSVSLAVTATVFLSLSASGASAALKEVHIALSFPNGVAWPYFSVAEDMGYAKDEGIKFRISSTDGSAASYKVLVAGQADYAFTQPAQVLNGLAQGEDVVSIYTAYQGHVYQFATLASSAYHRIADLKGTKIGISSVAGGQYPYLLATLKGAGLTVGPGKDVEIAEVGRGGAATIALKDKRVAAYSASFVDMMAIKLNGEKLRFFNEGPTSTFFSDSLVARRADLAKDPKTAVAVGRAIAKATVYCFANTESCWEMVAKHVPNTTRKPGFTKPLLKEVLALHELPKDANGQWGYQRPYAWQAVETYLLDSGQLKKKVDVSKAFTNAYIADINKFDSKKIIAQAKAAKTN